MTNKLCSCGFPQSYPIPHEHDRTERENQIIEYYENSTREMYETLEAFDEYLRTNYPANIRLRQIATERLDEALAKIMAK